MLCRSTIRRPARNREDGERPPAVLFGVWHFALCAAVGVRTKALLELSRNMKTLTQSILRSRSQVLVSNTRNTGSPNFPANTRSNQNRLHYRSYLRGHN